jgi:hypothetical protein
MQINTRLDKIELTKRERKTLTDAMDLLGLLQKHADSATSNCAAIAVRNIATTLDSLEAEPVEAPY